MIPHSTDPGEAIDANLGVFSQAIDECLELYRGSADVWVRSLPADTSASDCEATTALMDGLARGLLLKIFLTIVKADKRFSSAERQLARILIAKAWGRTFSAEEIGPVLRELSVMADKFDWYSLVRPFESVPELRDRVSQLETVVMRLGNLVAKADGTLGPDEALQLKGISAEIARHLHPVPLDGDEPRLGTGPASQEIRQAVDALPKATAVAGHPPVPPPPPPPTSAPTREQRLESALKSLDELIGLEAIKNEVRELSRFLKVQQQREQAGLPRTQVSLHTVFAGNPGTGKTIVARILGDILGALGIVAQGHLVEADRSALVAGYAGQTTERTNKIVDRALDGVLFVDEAYSLVSSEGDDSFGQEAVQTLLKRMEDDRSRLVVVLAGYPDEMDRLLATNPGLHSRFQRTFVFPDFSIVELCRIFQSLCDKNHYELPSETRARLILAFDYLLAHRDEHFGNGRLVRNMFEHAIRRLANRVADVVPLTKELLTQLEPADILAPDVPDATVDSKAVAEMQVSVSCPGCGQASKMKAKYLGRLMRCKKCDRPFTAEWGDPINR